MSVLSLVAPAYWGLHAEASHPCLQPRAPHGASLPWHLSIDDAADCFHRYLMESGESKESMIENELELIRAKGITEPEIQMMLYIL